MRINRAVVWVAILLTLCAGAALVLTIAAREPEIAAIPRPDPASFARTEVERGRVLAGYGDCLACHTRQNGSAFAGNRPIATPFGTIYTTNITPDVETGLGGWSREAFRRAMKRGIDRKGTHLYPAFPYDQFTRVRDADIDAIYSYLMASVAPVREARLDNAVWFPLNLRSGLVVWKRLFLEQTPLQPDSTRNAKWNEGRYLVEGLGHCAACHSPRNILGARTTPAYGGGAAEGWYAPPLDASNLSRLPWTETEFVVYLMDGWHDRHGMAAGPMTPVVDALHEQSEIDVFAIANYLVSLRAGERPIDAAAVSAAARRLEWGHPDAPTVARTFSDGAKIFAARCAQCHHHNGDTVPLALQTSIHSPVPDSVVEAIRNGITPPRGALGRSMPAFGEQLSDDQLEELVDFLRARFSNEDAW